MNLPLQDTRVVEAIGAQAPEALRLAAALAGRIAADLGAAVVRVEAAAEPPRGPLPLTLGLGKRTLRCRNADIADLLADATAGADAVLVDGALYDSIGERLGRALPVVVTMTADAVAAPESELTVAARSGMLDIVGDPALAPLCLGGHQTAYAGGLAAYLALVAGIVRRSGDQHRQKPLRVSLVDVSVWLNWKTLGMVEVAGFSPMRAGMGADWVIVPCKDGYVATVFRFNEWPALKAATGDPRLEDERFATPAGRRANARALNAILAEIFAAMTRAEIKALSIRHKLPLGPVWTPAELLEDPHMRARGFFHATTSGDGGSMQLPRLPVRWNGAQFDQGPLEARLQADGTEQGP
jgi:crotonobetainyl-CoA:carnitine CoA-transferase CaiB-like acyl-CoA transferase